jgi:HSP20 family protein
VSARGPRDGGRGGSDPARDLQGLRDRTNRLLEGVLRLGEAGGDAPGGWSPLVDLREDSEGYLVHFEIPGVRPDEVTIRLEGNRLTVEGRRHQERKERGAEMLRMECGHGAFSRTLHLPDPVDPRGVRARLRRGVLEIALARSRAARKEAVRIGVEPS